MTGDKMKKDSIGNRMKENYENRYRIKLTRRVPVILRLDGKAFHTFVKKINAFYLPFLLIARLLTAVDFLFH